jgi:hypothetical protein
MTTKKHWKGRYFVNRTGAAEFLGITPRTWRKYRDLLGIQARKIYRQSGKWFTFEDVKRCVNYMPHRHIAGLKRLERDWMSLRGKRGRPSDVSTSR